MKNQGKQKKWIIGLCILCLLLIVGIATYFMLRDKDNGLELDDNATIGIMPGVDIAQRQAELQEQLDEAMIAFSINTNPVFESGSSEGNLMLENPVTTQNCL